MSKTAPIAMLLTKDLDITLPHALPQQLTAQRKITELEESLSDLTHAATALTKDHSSLIKRIKGLQKGMHCIERKVVQECNKDRQEKSIVAVRMDFEATRQDMGCASTTPLPVFCVASNAYLNYQTQSGTRMLGFPSESDTGIPSLRDWLNKLTFDGREKIARSIVDATEILIVAMKPWVEDRRGDVKLSSQERADLISIFETEVEELDQVCANHI
jgi:hypothetical protein